MILLSRYDINCTSFKCDEMLSNWDRKMKAIYMAKEIEVRLNYQISNSANVFFDIEYNTQPKSKRICFSFYSFFPVPNTKHIHSYHRWRYT